MRTLLILLLFISFELFGQDPKKVIMLNTDTKIYLVEHNNPSENGSVGVLLVKHEPIKVYQKPTGEYYAKYLNSIGTEMKKDLGWKNTTGLIEYEGMTVFRNSNSTKFYYVQLDKDGSPVLIQIPDAWTK